MVAWAPAFLKLPPRFQSAAQGRLSIFSVASRGSHSWGSGLCSQLDQKVCETWEPTSCASHRPQGLEHPVNTQSANTEDKTLVVRAALGPWTAHSVSHSYRNASRWKKSHQPSLVDGKLRLNRSEAHP
jgi:hypothetical protein